MGRTTKTVAFSLPPEMATKMEEIMREEGRTRSELLREAIRRYVEEREWKQVLRYGGRRAREQSRAPGDVEDLVDEYRSETAQPAPRP